MAKNCLQLTSLNLNYTAVPPLALAPVLRNCAALEVLKVAGIQPQWVSILVLFNRSTRIDSSADGRDCFETYSWAPTGRRLHA